MTQKTGKNKLFHQLKTTKIWQWFTISPFTGSFFSAKNYLNFSEIRKLFFVYIQNQSSYFDLPPITLEGWKMTLVTSFLWSNSIFACQLVVFLIPKLWALKPAKKYGETAVLKFSTYHFWFPYILCDSWWLSVLFQVP